MSASKIIHIHGNNDRTIPLKNVKCDHVIDRGSHMMTLTKGNEISRLLNEILKKNSTYRPAMNKKINKKRLTKIDMERWRFVLYTDEDGDWFGDFSYAPKSWIDLSMLIQLTPEEKQQASNNRDFLIQLSEEIRNNFRNFFPRSEDRKKYIIE